MVSMDDEDEVRVELCNHEITRFGECVFCGLIIDDGENEE